MTGEPGGECPECAQRLTSASCACGWRPSSASRRCDECSARVALELDDDGELRCAACHVAYLRMRAALDPIDVEELARCRAAIATALERVAARARPTSIAVFEAPGVDPGGSHPENSR